jgi:hypothetical protein
MRGEGSSRGNIGCVRKRESRSLAELKPACPAGRLRPPENLDAFRNSGERGEFFVLSPMGTA